MSITVDMIQDFRDQGYCLPSYPCSHQLFELKLKDGRIKVVHLETRDIYSILKALKEIGKYHSDWGHFAYYSTIEKMGYEVRPADTILAEIFKKST